MITVEGVKCNALLGYATIVSFTNKNSYEYITVTGL